MCAGQPQGSMGENKQQEAMFEVTEKLNTCWTDSQKGIKLATKMHEKAFEHSSSSPRMATAVDDLFTTMERAEKCQSELGFLLKFKKAKSGAALTVSVGQEHVHSSAHAMSELLHCTKVVKALLPSKADG